MIKGNPLKSEIRLNAGSLMINYIQEIKQLETFHYFIGIKINLLQVHVKALNHTEIRHIKGNINAIIDFLEFVLSKEDNLYILLYNL